MVARILRMRASAALGMSENLQYSSIDPVTQLILDELALHGGGVSIDALTAALAGQASRRTVQRRVRALAESGLIQATGRGKARLYAALPKDASGRDGPVDATRPPVAAPEFYVPLSPSSEVTRAYVRLPIQEREPVGYDRAFLEAYQPNLTYYLSAEIREHLGRIGRPAEPQRPAGTYAREILDRLLIDLSWASSRLEGNTYSRLDTQQLIAFGREAEGKDRSEAQMILNHKAAIELLVENADTIGFDAYTFQNLHALLSDNLLADPRDGGRIRARLVGISGTVFQPLNIPQQIEQLFRLLLEKAGAIRDPFEQAFFVMVQLPYLQPFVDVNKRVSRLGANIPFIRLNLCPLSFVDVPEAAYVEGTLGVYERCRTDLLADVFVWAYERSCQRYIALKKTIAEPDPFRLRYREALQAVAAEIVRDGLRPTADAVDERCRSLVHDDDRPRFVEMVLVDLADLHEGNISRYRLRLSEYRAWQPMRTSAAS